MTHHHLFYDCRVTIVEIRLLLSKLVQVELFPNLIPFPRRSSEHTQLLERQSNIKLGTKAYLFLGRTKFRDLA